MQMLSINPFLVDSYVQTYKASRKHSKMAFTNASLTPNYLDEAPSSNPRGVSRAVH